MGNDYLSTEQVAERFGVLPQSVRHAISVKGSYCGIRPQKRANRFLAWPRAQVEAVLRGERLPADAVQALGVRR